VEKKSIEKEKGSCEEGGGGSLAVGGHLGGLQAKRGVSEKWGKEVYGKKRMNPRKFRLKRERGGTVRKVGTEMESHNENKKQADSQNTD